MKEFKIEDLKHMLYEKNITVAEDELQYLLKEMNQAYQKRQKLGDDELLNVTGGTSIGITAPEVDVAAMSVVLDALLDKIKSITQEKEIKAFGTGSDKDFFSGGNNGSHNNLG